MTEEYLEKKKENHKTRNLFLSVSLVGFLFALIFLILGMYKQYFPYNGYDFDGAGSLSPNTLITSFVLDNDEFPSDWFYIGSEEGESPTILEYGGDYFISYSKVSSGLKTPYIAPATNNCRIKLGLIVQNGEPSSIDFSNVFLFQGYNDKDMLVCNITSFYIDKDGYYTYTMPESFIKYIMITIKTLPGNITFGIHECKWVYINNM